MFQYTRAFGSFAVDDVARAKTFYEETLGLRVSSEMEGLLQLHLPDGQTTMIYAKPDYTPATFTVLNFQVEDVDRAVDELEARGVRFERYEGFDQDDKGVMRDNGPAIAWFTDPAGNILSVLQDG